MTPTDHHDESYEHNEDVAHEHSDIDIRTVLIAALVLAAVVAIASVAMWGVFEVLESQAAANDPQVSPLALPSGELPPQPRIEWNLNERRGLKQAREAEAKALGEYGWIDQATGVARIPIDEAKKRLLERGLPSRPSAVDPRQGTKAPAYGEASGGRQLGVRR